MAQKVFINRTLNLKKIQYIGFDMDHTLIRYKTENFEHLAYRFMIERLIARGYPESLKKLPFEFNRSIRGLVMDRQRGNLLKLNRWAGIRLSYHGTKPIDFSTQKSIYKSIYIDLGDSNYSAVDSAFAISFSLLFSQLVDLKDNGEKDTLPSYEVMSRDLEEAMDECHRNGSLKGEVRKNLDKYIHHDPTIAASLERFKKHGKKLFILTNSNFDYVKLLLDSVLNPHLKKHREWQDLFDLVITGAQKPRFFWDNLPIYSVNSKTGALTPETEAISTGLYHGGCASRFTKSLGVSGEDILYIGDHIYGDIVRLKKDCNWRTGLVVEELEEEVQKLREVSRLDDEISRLMIEKRPFEERLLQLTTESKDTDKPIDDGILDPLQSKASAIDQKISELIRQRQKVFNPYWGEVMRIGNEESMFAYQVERFACIYMSKISDLLEISPRSYLRSQRRLMPHEVAEGDIGTDY